MAIIFDYKDRYFGVFADNHNTTTPKTHWVMVVSVSKVKA